MRMNKANRQRVYIYGGLVAGMSAGYFFQPVRIDLIPRRVPANRPAVDPDSSTLFHEGTRVVLVTAHPDDAEYYLGGTLLKLAQAKAKVWLVVCTDGDKAYYFWADMSSLRRTRRVEQAKAGKEWGALGVEFLGFPDGRLHANADVVSRLSQKLQELKPDYVLGFDGEYPPRASHGDHRAAGDATFKAAKASGAKWLLLYSTIAPDYSIDVSNQWEERLKLLAIHESQFSGEKLKRVQDSITSDAMEAAGEGNASYVEPVRCIKLR